MSRERPALVRMVEKWARENRPDAYRYSSPASYWSDALYESVITPDEFHSGKMFWGDSWDRSGD